MMFILPRLAGYYKNRVAVLYSEQALGHGHQTHELPAAAAGQNDIVLLDMVAHGAVQQFLHQTPLVAG